MSFQSLTGAGLVMRRADGFDRVRRDGQRVGGDRRRNDGGFQEARQRGDG